MKRVAIVTGAATGVGAACAEWFAGANVNVLVNFRESAQAAADVAERCSSKGVEAHVEQGDVAVDRDCHRIAQSALSRWGRIDYLVNSAGTTLFRSLSDLDAVDSDDFMRIYGVNAVGPYQMIRAVSRHMETGSAIVNVSSIGGANGTGSSYAYLASKGALNSLTLALARNLAPRIRVNAVLPGMIQGRWLKEGIGEEAYLKVRDRFANDAALGVVATPAQVASTIGWLCMAAELVTGQLVTIDAGLMLGRPPKVLE